MKLSLIVAMGKQRQIGLEGRLPWRIPLELKNFKRITMGHHLLMGRKTFQSLPQSLPGRKIIILSKSSLDNSFSSVSEAIDFAEKEGEEELFICGGEQIYRQCLPLVQFFYRSEIDYVGPGDAFFPPYRELDWKEISQTDYPAQGTSPAWKFTLLQRVN